MTTLSDTPRSNEADSKWETSESVVDAFNVAIDLFRELERELAAANSKIKALVEAGDKLVDPAWGNYGWKSSDLNKLIDAWKVAKKGAK